MIDIDEMNQLKNRISELHSENHAIEEKKLYFEKSLETLQENVVSLENSLENERKNFTESKSMTFI